MILPCISFVARNEFPRKAPYYSLLREAETDTIPTATRAAIITVASPVMPAEVKTLSG